MLTIRVETGRQRFQGTIIRGCLFPLEMNKDLTPTLLEPDSTLAIIGATDTPGKYGGIIYRDMKAKGFTVFAVNPGRDTVDGDPCYHSVNDLPETPTIAVFVVPAPRGVRVLEQCREAGIRNIWIQPGAFSSAFRSALDGDDFDWVAEACVMVRARVHS